MLRTTTFLTLSAAAVAAAAASASGGVPPCRTADLTARIVQESAGAGQRYATLELTNRSGHTCHTYGYPGLLLLDSRGRPMATHAIWVRPPAPHRVTLAPGASAGSELHWSVINSRGDATGPCVTPPRWLEVTLPDETTHRTIPWVHETVCERGTIRELRLR